MKTKTHRYPARCSKCGLPFTSNEREELASDIYWRCPRCEAPVLRERVEQRTFFAALNIANPRDGPIRKR